MRRFFRSALAFAASAVLSLATLAGASEREPIRVTGNRVSLLDVMPECPPSACKSDLGAAPPPGTSSRIDASAIRAALSSAGEPVPAGVVGVRVISAARVLTPEEAGELLRPSVESALPEGVRLTSLEAKNKITLPLLAVAGTATLPKLPRRAGPAVTTAMVDVNLDGVLVRRVPVLVRLTIAASAARADVPRGHAVTLVIERRNVTISMDGLALRDAEIGEVAPFRVQRTGRVLNAFVKSSGTAMVLEVD